MPANAGDIADAADTAGSIGAAGKAAAPPAAADRPGPVRPGEELPLAPLAAWLDQHLPAIEASPSAAAAGFPRSDTAAPGSPVPNSTVPGSPVPGSPVPGSPVPSSTAPGPPAPASSSPGAAAPPPLTVEQFPGGHSNLTYLLRRGERELVLRRPPPGASVKSAHDMGREHRVLSHLHRWYAKAPRALAACDDPAVIGAPFFLMERVRGVILRRQPPGLPGAAPAPERLRAASAAAVDALAELHGVDAAAPGLADLGRPAGYAARQVGGWTERWQRAATDPVPDLDRAAAWLAEHLPRRSPEAEAAAATVIHNDFKLDNLVLTPDLGTVVAVLDWEMATVGDPLMDLGTSLGYWLDPDDEEALGRLPVGLTALPGNLSRAEVVERYARATGRDTAGILFYYVFGLFKIAVIAQQIYHRYHHGLTRDERFAPLHDSVRLLGRTAAQALARQRIDRLWD